MAMTEVLKSKKYGDYHTKEFWYKIGLMKGFQGNAETLIKNFISVSDFILSDDFDDKYYTPLNLERVIYSIITCINSKCDDAIINDAKSLFDFIEEYSKKCLEHYENVLKHGGVIDVTVHLLSDCSDAIINIIKNNA